MGNVVCTIVGSDKGGVGKSMLSLIMVLVHDNAGLPLTVVEIDNQRRLTGLLGEDRVDVSLPAAPDIRQVSRDRHAAEAFFNRAYAAWNSGRSLTDLGANVTTSLMAWIRQCHIGELAAEDGIGFRFVACTSPDDQALKSALHSVTDAMSSLGPSADYFVVLNDLSGGTGFDVYRSNEAYRQLLAMEEKGMISILAVPYCDSMLLEYGRAHGMTPLDAFHRSDELAAMVGLDPIGARVQKKKMMSWLRDVQEALMPLLTVDEPEPTSHAAVGG